jgi:hypothetical protein
MTDEAFSIVIRGGTAVLPQGVVRMSNDTMLCGKLGGEEVMRGLRAALRAS